MKKQLTAVAMSLSVILTAQIASADTAWYQPTPFPESVNATIPEASRHFTQGWIAVDGNFTPIQQNSRTLQQGPWLLTGAGSANYRWLTFIKFDLTGLPSQVDAAYVWLLPGAANSPYLFSPYAVCPLLGQWNAISSWVALPSIGTCVGWYPAPNAGMWSGFSLSGTDNQDWYTKWQNGSLANNGVMIYTQNTNSVANFFVGSQYPPAYDGARPILQLNFTPPIPVPNFKLPLPGGTSWLLTNEVGGYECSGRAPWPDTAHQGDNYFSIDIAPTNHDGNGNAVYTGYIPIIAAAGGKVTQAGWDAAKPGNGYSVVINHNNDLSNSIGFSTRYLHMQSDLKVGPGDSVTQGQLLGYMGGTGVGNNDRVHLHFGMRYSAYAGDTEYGSSASKVQYATVDRWLMKSFQTECQNGTWIRYYSSSNKTYPHHN